MTINLSTHPFPRTITHDLSVPDDPREIHTFTLPLVALGRSGHKIPLRSLKAIERVIHLGAHDLTASPAMARRVEQDVRCLVAAYLTHCQHAYGTRAFYWVEGRRATQVEWAHTEGDYARAISVLHSSPLRGGSHH